MLLELVPATSSVAVQSASGGLPGEIVALLIVLLLVTGALLVLPLLRDIRADTGARRRVEERNRDILERVSDWIWEVDAQPVFTYCSPRCKELLGYEPDELLGKHPHILFAPEERERAAVEFERLTAERRPFVRVENVNLRKDGTPVVLETSATPILGEDGELLGYRGVDRDVTERKTAERTLSRVTRALQVLSRGSEVIIRADDEPALLRDVCRVAVEQGGYRMAWIGYARSEEEGWRVEPVGRWGDGGGYADHITVTWNDTVTGQGPAGRAIRDRRAVASRRISEDPSFAPWQKEATTQGLRAVAALPLLHSSLCYGSLNVYAAEDDAFDADEIEVLRRLAIDLAFGIRSLRLRREREDLEELMRNHQRMESLGELTAGLAHDINNLLTVILGSAGVLEETTDVHDRDFRSSVADIKSATENGAALVRKLLTFSRSETPTLEDLDLGKVTLEQCRLLARVLPETVEVDASEADEPLRVHADPRALEQILMNLAFNARDAMPQGGTLKVRTYRREVSLGEQGFDGPAAPGEYACIEVSDTGSGMDDDAIPRLFEPFFTTKARERGTGLGLSVVYGHVQGHRGFLQVESAVGKGTTMRVFLPLAGTRLADAAPTGGDRSPEADLILVAEDDPHVREATARVLERHGYRVVTGGDGSDVLSVLDGRAHEVILVISDIVMPGMGGPELVERLRETGHTVPVVLTSGRSAEELAGIVEAEAPVVAILEKPWTMEELLDSVQAALDGNG